jgi:hypothetical protein
MTTAISHPSTDGFWWLLTFPRLLSQGLVALDCRPMVMCVLDVYFGVNFNVFCAHS